jgi:hypothetical protein
MKRLLCGALLVLLVPGLGGPAFALPSGEESVSFLDARTDDHGAPCDLRQTLAA